VTAIAFECPRRFTFKPLVGFCRRVVIKISEHEGLITVARVLCGSQLCSVCADFVSVTHISSSPSSVEKCVGARFPCILVALMGSPEATRAAMSIPSSGQKESGSLVLSLRSDRSWCRSATSGPIRPRISLIGKERLTYTRSRKVDRKESVLKAQRSEEGLQHFKGVCLSACIFAEEQA
jgi:hypothetical protein